MSNLKSTFVIIKCITLSAHSTTHSQCQTPKPATAQLILWSHPLIVIIKLCIVNNRKWETFDFRKPLNGGTLILHWKFHLEIEINLLVLRNVKWPFYDHFWPFFANCISIFHKKEVQTVILRCIMSLNSNWIKSYDMITVKIYFFMPSFQS